MNFGPGKVGVVKTRVQCHTFPTFAADCNFDFYTVLLLHIVWVAVVIRFVVTVSIDNRTVPSGCLPAVRRARLTNVNIVSKSSGPRVFPSPKRVTLGPCIDDIGGMSTSELTIRGCLMNRKWTKEALGSQTGIDEFGITTAPVDPQSAALDVEPTDLEDEQATAADLFARRVGRCDAHEFHTAPNRGVYMVEPNVYIRVTGMLPPFDFECTRTGLIMWVRVRDYTITHHVVPLSFIVVSCVSKVDTIPIFGCVERVGDVIVLVKPIVPCEVLCHSFGTVSCTKHSIE